MEHVKRIISILNKRKILVSPDALSILKSLTREEAERITRILENLPDRDVSIISTSLARFLTLAKRLTADEYFSIKTRLAVKHGTKLYDNYLALFEREAQSISLRVQKEKRVLPTTQSNASHPSPTPHSTHHHAPQEIHPDAPHETRPAEASPTISQATHTQPSSTPTPSSTSPLPPQALPKQNSTPPSPPPTPTIQSSTPSPTPPSLKPSSHPAGTTPSKPHAQRTQDPSHTTTQSPSQTLPNASTPEEPPLSSREENTPSTLPSDKETPGLPRIQSQQSAASNTPRLPQEGIDYELVKTPQDGNGKRDLHAFISLFHTRYQRMKTFLTQRPDVTGVLPLRRAKQSNGEDVTIIVMIRTIDKREDRMTILAEDEHEEITIRISKKNGQEKAWEEAQDLTEDDVIAISGTMRNGTLYAKRIVHPDVPLGKELPRSPEEEYAVFISDLQYGSVDFLQDVFERFLAWIQGEDPDPALQRIARKTRYLFIVGDLLDGIGIYPKQYEELTVKSVRGQFDGAAALLKRIPPHIRIFIIPGNHDPVRLAEPQHPFYKKHAEPLYAMPNVTILPNPSWVRIAKKKHFPGITILLYHGYSFDYYANDIPSIHENGGYDNPVLLMSYLLKRRHLAPNYKSTLIMPGSEDPLIIDPLPDVFAAGHIHRTRVGMYRNILLLETGCWQGMTPYMEKTGHIPEPGKAIILPLHTMKPSIIDFLGEDDIHTRAV